MRLTYADAATPAHAVKVGDRVRERRTGEVREVREIAATLAERRMILDDGTHIDCMFLDTLFVTTDQVTGSTEPVASGPYHPRPASPELASARDEAERQALASKSTEPVASGPYHPRPASPELASARDEAERQALASKSSEREPA